MEQGAVAALAVDEVIAGRVRVGVQYGDGEGGEQQDLKGRRGHPQSLLLSGAVVEEISRTGNVSSAANHLQAAIGRSHEEAIIFHCFRAKRLFFNLF